MAISPWNVLAAGKIRSDAEEEKRRQTGEKGRTLWTDWERTETERKVCSALEKVAEEISAKHLQSGEDIYLLIKIRMMGTHDASVAIAYLMQKAPFVFPIVGGRKVEHLYANLEALEIALSPEQIDFLDNVIPFRKGFPYDMFVSTTNLNGFIC